MNSAIAIFFASLVSGVMSLAELRPTVADMVQILTGVQITEEEDTVKDSRISVCSTIRKSKDQQLLNDPAQNNCRKVYHKGAAYAQGQVYILS